MSGVGITPFKGPNTVPCLNPGLFPRDCLSYMIPSPLENSVLKSNQNVITWDQIGKDVLSIHSNKICIFFLKVITRDGISVN